MATTERTQPDTSIKLPTEDGTEKNNAAFTTTNNTAVVNTTTSTAWQMEVLMERLRSKAGGFRSLLDSAKWIKQSIMNKHHLLDPGERVTMGSCLDSLQKNIKVTTLSAMIERLEATARHLGLKFTAGTTGSDVYVSCDMFYVEVVLEQDGRIRDVKVELAGDQNATEGLSSPELVDCLSRGDFADFTAHLEGFSSIYLLNAEKKTKSKAFQALQALETDLTKLFELAQETITDPYKLVLKSPVGLLQQRKGGHAMRLVYFVSPYELLDVAAGHAVTLTTDTPSSRDLSHYVTVNIEPSNSHKLQTTTLMIITKQANGKKLPSFSGPTNDNSMTLPACFSLKLHQPMPVSMALIQRINEVTGLDCADPSNEQSLIMLIIQQAAHGSEYSSSRGLFVTLPDQQHCYFMTSAGELTGVMVSSIPFTHPTHITSILMCLRAQAAFNALIASCVRPASKQDLDSSYVFEVTAASHEYISVTFEHPQEESTATAEIDLTDLCNARCRLHTLTPDPGFCSEEYVTKVLQRCMSIPVTMRAVMRKVAKEERKDQVMSGDSAVMMGSGKLNSDFNQNTTKFLLNEYDKLGIRREQLMAPHMNSLNNVVTNTAGGGHGYYNGPYLTNQHPGGDTNPLAALGNAVQEAGTPLGYGALSGVVGLKPGLNQPFLAEAKSPKVRKKKTGYDVDRKSKYVDDVIDIDDHSSDSYLGDSVSSLVDIKRRDIKVEKVANVLNKRRSSSDSGAADIGTSDLAALREQVYGAANAANYVKLNSYTLKESKDVKKVKKPRTDGSDSRKSPIVLDLTETDSSSKKSSSSSSSSSASLSAALLKRPGIEIIPIPGSNTPISIPSSITVTPVLKSEDKYKDKKERRDKKDVDRKDKKRKREDSPSSSSSSNSSKPAKVQIISSSIKHSSISFKGENSSKSGLSGITMKPSTPPYQSPSKKSSLSPSISKSVLPSKVSLSPTHKSSKVIYSPTQGSNSQSSSPKGRSSPKPSSGSPKQPNMSPKHTSLGKPSMTQLKSSASPTFSKPSLSPKLNKSKEKDRNSSSSPSRQTSSSSSLSSSSSSTSSSSSSSSSSSKPKMSSSSSVVSEKIKNGLSDALTITKVSTGESSSSSSLASSFLAGTQTHSTSSSSLDDKPLFSTDKAKASPPKNRKGPSLSDIVDKLRVGAGNSSDAVTIIEKNEKSQKEASKSDPNESKKDAEKKAEFTIKSSNTVGLKLTINKAKMKDGSVPKSASSSSSSSSSSTSSSSKSAISKSPSGLKPGVMSGPASKKMSVSNLPPIPKLPRSSVSPVTATAVSPLGTTLPGVHSSPLQYQRERTKDKEKDRSSSGERIKPKETSPTKSSNTSSSEGKKDISSGKHTFVKQLPKDDQSGSHRKLESSENLDKISKSMSDLRNEKPDKPSNTKSESDSGFTLNADSSSTSKSSESYEKGTLNHLSDSMNTASKLLSGSSGGAFSAVPVTPSSGDIVSRSQDTFQSSSYKSNKETKEDAKVKPDSMGIPARPISSSNSASNSSTSLDPLSTDSGPQASVSSALSSLNSMTLPSSQASLHPPSKLLDSQDHTNSSNQDPVEKSKLNEDISSNAMPGPQSTSIPINQPLPKPPTPNLGYPPSPSLSIKIVKSPAPVTSPLNMISPHSVASQPIASPCIIDDELMDEALMGTRK